MAGLFGAYGASAAEVNENPFTITNPNTYECEVTDVDITDFGKGNGINYFVIEYTITQEGPENGKKATSMHRMRPYTEAERAGKGKNGSNDYQALNARGLSGYKKELLGLGLPEDRLELFDPEDQMHRNRLMGLKGAAFFSQQKNRPEYNQVSGFVISDEQVDAIADAKPTVNPTDASLSSAIASPDAADAAIPGWDD